MKITKLWLEEKLACSEGICWFMEQKETSAVDVLKGLMNANKFPWANWLICRLMDKPNCVRYAIFAAEQVLYIYEKRNPENKAARKAIKAAQCWVDNPCEDTSIAAAAAADHAAAAAAAAYAAAAAAYAAAAADHAAAAAAADYAAAAAAAYARRSLQIKILEYGIELLSKFLIKAEGK